MWALRFRVLPDYLAYDLVPEYSPLVATEINGPIDICSDARPCHCVCFRQELWPTALLSFEHIDAMTCIVGRSGRFLFKVTCKPEQLRRAVWKSLHYLQGLVFIVLHDYNGNLRGLVDDFRSSTRGHQGSFLMESSLDRDWLLRHLEPLAALPTVLLHVSIMKGPLWGFSVASFNDRPFSAETQLALRLLQRYTAWL